MIKKIAAINDLSGAGKCSLTVAIPVLSALGVQACPLPTAILSNQTGYPHFFIKDFTENMPSIISQWKSLGFEFDGIYTGFLSDEKQVDIIEDFVKTFKKDKTILLVDPVMGDGGQNYPNFSKDLIDKISKLAFMADVITPNLTECCILTKTDYSELIEHSHKNDYLEVISKTAQKLITGSIKAAVVTGIRFKDEYDNEEMLYNAIVEKDDIKFVKSKIFGGSYSGTGDILSSVICGMLTKGKGIEEAVQLAVKFVGAAVEDTHRCGTDRNHGVNFEKFMHILTNAALDL